MPNEPDAWGDPIFEPPTPYPAGHTAEEVDAWLGKIGGLIGRQLAEFTPTNHYEAELLDETQASLAGNPVEGWGVSVPVFVLWLACPNPAHRRQGGVWWHHPAGGEPIVHPTRYVQGQGLAPIRAQVTNPEGFASWAAHWDRNRLPTTPDVLAPLLKNRTISLQWAPEPDRPATPKVGFACPYCATPGRKAKPSYRWRVDDSRLLRVLAGYERIAEADHPGRKLNEVGTTPADQFAEFVRKAGTMRHAD